MSFLIDGSETDEGFPLVEHPMSPCALAVPLHRQMNEDEYSFAPEGRMGAIQGDEVLEGVPGDLVFEPRGQWHTFWNASDYPTRILEIIAPAGVEQSFDRLSDIFDRLSDMDRVTAAPPQTLGALCAIHTRHSLRHAPVSASLNMNRMERKFV